MALFVFNTPDELNDALCRDLVQYLAAMKVYREPVHLAFSGGNTPGLFYDKLAALRHDLSKSPDWSRIHFYWADERCVPPDHPESNFGMAQSRLLQYIDPGEDRIHRIRGEGDPASEALRYAEEILRHVPLEDRFPVFDLVFLGMGEDGHTASLFPGKPGLLRSASVCEAVKHPVTGQYRITLTGPPIIKARRLIFLVSGKVKSHMAGIILNREPGSENYPAGYIDRASGKADWYLDSDAASEINRNQTW